jgi:hypothetical protein
LEPKFLNHKVAVHHRFRPATAAFRIMDKNSHDAISVSEDSRARRSHDQAASNALIVKCVFMLTLLVATSGWLWLLGKGAVAIVVDMVP